ncbi:Protein artichoke [Gryllus bimaculatus]|nr:Protein artichoke [Gryllus bimaculatus]
MSELQSGFPSCITSGEQGSRSDEVDSLIIDSVTLHTTSNGRIEASRAPHERDRRPDRICLDRRGLTKLPVIIGEPRLRLLSMQHNLISRLDDLSLQSLSRLVFLDIYDNQLEKVSGLDYLENLRVLLMGKNRIRRIEGLNNLRKLEVLDLHGNQIYQVGGLTYLQELKVLNLAGNQIRVIGVNDLHGLKSLQEFNLRRNRLKRLLGFAETPQLQKLFLSNNELSVVDNMTSITKATELRELTIDNNPVSLGGDCVSFLVSYLPNLKSLSHMEVTDSVRKAALMWRANREGTQNQLCVKSSDSVVDAKREEVISNARTNWELLRSQTRGFPMENHLSGSLKDLRTELDVDMNAERCVQSDSGISITSSLTANSIKPAVRELPIGDAEKRRSKFSRRTQSQDSEASQFTTVTSNSTSFEFFKLPPILAPLFGSMAIDKEEGNLSQSEIASDGPVIRNEIIRRWDSLSSVEPNVDSSLSSLPSDSSSSEEIDSSEELGSSKETNLQAEDSKRSIKSAMPYRKHVSRKPMLRATTARPKQKSLSASCKTREQGGDFLVEICGRCLNIYGQGALRFIDRPWNSSKAGDVTIVKFTYMNFNNIIPVLGRLKIRFPNVEHYIFRETNLHCLGQLNALADVQGLTSLQIDCEGNPITQKEWQKYAIYRLSHWGLRCINGVEITDEDITTACEEFQGLSNIVLWSLPESLLQPLLSRLRLEGSRGSSQQSAKQWLFTADPALRSVVAKEALQWRRGTLTQEDLLWRHKGRVHLAYLIELACSAIEKLKILEKQWPSILEELVRDTLVDYSELDTYMKKCMQELTT